MGVEVYIRLASDEDDKQSIAPFLGRDFWWEITRGYIWENKQPFLTEEETSLLEASRYDDFKDDLGKKVRPKDLALVIEKVKKYLKENEDSLPFEIDLDYKKMDKEGLDTDIIINESRCWLRGDSLYHEISDKINVVNYPTEKNDVDMWISISDKVEIENRLYYLKKTSMFDKHSPKLDEILHFCRLAEQRSEMIYWLFDH
ncbi:hypothetical protein [Bernardetia sp.]|uniref:hypothetical protein n=1 Tax=Bernardetia sp. TaxID=1937974 RepID=UPI0025C5C60E|nr:hypothetical protein [Bernardetia sp.]